MANHETLPEEPAAFIVPATRSDGWTGERIATFLEVLADTGIIKEACRAAGMSPQGVYPLRNRDPVFAAAWRAAQARARTVVADGLLERSITGTVEHYYRDGVLVGERRHYESWLGLAMLKRLDRQAEEDRRAQHARGAGEQGDRAQAVRGTAEHADDGNALAADIGEHWRESLDAIRTDGTAAVAAALAKAGEIDEVDIPPPPGSDPSDDIWQTDDGAWMTSFPPPPGFDGQESRKWDGFNRYVRTCTAEEIALVEAHEAAAVAADRAETTAYAEEERDKYFAKLRAELAEMAAAAPDAADTNSRAQ